ncbi:MAG: hypothetical protein ACRD3H_00725, partial [Terriglobales bacterium]
AVNVQDSAFQPALRSPVTFWPLCNDPGVSVCIASVYIKDEAGSFDDDSLDGQMHYVGQQKRPLTIE